MSILKRSKDTSLLLDRILHWTLVVICRHFSWRIIQVVTECYCPLQTVSRAYPRRVPFFRPLQIPWRASALVYRAALPFTPRSHSI